MAQKASDLLNQSREVLYGEQTEQTEQITMQSMYQLLLGINSRLTVIETGMSKIDNLNNTLNKLVTNFGELKSKVNKIETATKNLKDKSDKQDTEIGTLKSEHITVRKDIRELNKKFSETANDLQGISNFMDDFKDKHEKNVSDVKLVKSSISKVANDLEDEAVEIRQEIKSALNDVREENDELRNTVLDLQCRSMRYNLIFTGLSEKENEDTENVVRQFVRHELRINHWIEFGNVHRFGSGALPGRRGRPKPIVARFLYHKDLAMVLSSTYRLKGKHFGVNQQFPDAIEQARKSLYPIMKEKRAQGCRVKLVRDVLYVDGVAYNEHEESHNSFVEPMDIHATPDNRTVPTGKRRRVVTPTHGN